MVTTRLNANSPPKELRGMALLTFVTRYLTDTVGAIKDDLDAVTSLPGNVVQAGENVGKAATNLVVSAVDNISGNGKDGFIDDYKGSIRNQELALQNKIDDQLTTALDNVAENPEQAQEALEALAKQALVADGLGDEDVQVVIYNSDQMSDEQNQAMVMGQSESKANMNAFYDEDSGTIYMNAATMTGSNSEIVATLANELSHYVDDKKGRAFDDRRQTISSTYEDNARDQIMGYSGEKVISQEESVQFQNKIAMNDFSKANQDAGAVVDVQPDIIVNWGDKELGRLETDLIDYSADIRSGLQTYDDIDTAIMMGAPGLALLDSPLPGPADAAALAVVGTSKVIKAGVKGIIKYGDEVADGVKPLGKAGDDVVDGGSDAYKTSKASRKEVMREQGIPTSQQPIYQAKNNSGWEYRYEVKKPGGGTEIKSVQQQTMDRSHPGVNHWEAGSIKKYNGTNIVKNNSYGRVRLDNNKSKANYINE